MQTRDIDWLCFILKGYGRSLQVLRLGIKCQNSFSSITRDLGWISEEMPYVHYKE